jgi:integrase
MVERLCLHVETRRFLFFIGSGLRLPQFHGSRPPTPEKELKYKIAIYIALFAGLRKSEILGLDWEHFNPVKQSLRIEQTRLIGRAVGVYTDSTKTLKSVRTITIPVELSNMLSTLKAQQEHTAELLGDEWDHSPAIMRGDFGRSLYPQVLTRWFTRFQKQHGLRYVGLHGLRHTHTSMLAYLNTDKMLISKRLGHSQLSTTLNIYTHLFDEVDNTAAALSSEFLPKKDLGEGLGRVNN